MPQWSEDCVVGDFTLIHMIQSSADPKHWPSCPSPGVVYISLWVVLLTTGLCVVAEYSENVIVVCSYPKVLLCQSGLQARYTDVSPCKAVCCMLN